MKTKKCGRCKIDRTLTNFTRDKSQKDLLYRTCKICQKEVNKQKRDKELELKVLIERNEELEAILEEKYEKYSDTNYYMESNRGIC